MDMLLSIPIGVTCMLTFRSTIKSIVSFTPKDSNEERILLTASGKVGRYGPDRLVTVSISDFHI